MPLWARVVATTAALRVAVALILYLAGLTTVAVETPIPPAAYAWLAFAFAALGVTLIGINRDDVRAAWLGGVLVLIAVQLTPALMPAGSNPTLSWIDRLRPDAFLAAFLWRFVLEFPSRRLGTLHAIGRWVAAAVAVPGTAAALVNLSRIVWPETTAGLGWRALLATGSTNTPESWYWVVVFVPSVAAVATLVGRLLASAGEDRIRSKIFVAGLVGGLLPLVAEVVVEELWPAYKALAHSPGVEPWLAVVLFFPLGLIPFVTAYAVVYDEVLQLRVVVRAAIQYLLARYTILAVTVIPFAALGLYLYEHRAESLVELFSGTRPLLLLATVAAGASTFRLRWHLLDAIDRRYFREPYDTQQLVAALLGEGLPSHTPDDIAARLAREFDRAIHARADLYVLDDDGVELRDPRDRRQPLDPRGTLMALALADSQPMDVSLAPGSAFDRLPESERAWLRQGAYRMLLALRSSQGVPVGLIALGAKRSELPFSAADRQSIAALLSPLALAIENDRLRRSPEPPSEGPAKECRSCSRLHAAGATTCPCGGSLVAGVAPHVLRGTFRLDRRIGRGGMGVVYQGIDLSLGRDVAIKTLPHTTPDHAKRLRREAKAMASVLHPNLAVIYGIETWRGTPFLIEEYLAGGTLAHRLRAGPLGIAEALRLCDTLCAVLGDLHESGVVHCDIKPGNIAFTNQMVPKLLDFGLVHLLRDLAPPTPATAAAGSEAIDVDSVVLTDRGVVGTPPYMCPEAIRGAQPSPSFDLWAVAVVCFEAIAGSRPFTGSTAFEIFEQVESGMVPDIRGFRPECPIEVAQFMARAFAGSPLARPRDARAFRREFATLLSTPLS